MTALQVYAILNKKIKGLISGVKSAVVNGNTITFTMNDGTQVPMTFPAPNDGKDAPSVVDIKITETTVDSKLEKHLIFEMSDGSKIDSGKLEFNNSGESFMQKPSMAQFPSVGNNNVLYLAIDTKKIYYWNGSNYEPIISDTVNSELILKKGTIIFDGINNTFSLPVDDITYNVYVNGIYYTENIDYTIDKTVSPNQISFMDVYDIDELCTLTYFDNNTTSGGGSEGDNCSCEPPVFATKSDIDTLFSGGEQ